MVKRRLIWASVLVPLYAVTWVGGWMSHAQQLKDHAEAAYQAAQQNEREEEAEARLEGLQIRPSKLHAGGPRYAVNWCVPVFPGVLLADSYSSTGPMYGG